MSLKEWLTNNLYVTSPDDPDVFFRPRRCAQPKAEVVKVVKEVIGSLNNWRLEEYRENQGLLRATRAVLFPPSAQEINIYVIRGLDGVTGVEMTSHSRGAKGDWGRNKRNLREFLARLDLLMPSLPEDKGFK